MSCVKWLLLFLMCHSTAVASESLLQQAAEEFRSLTSYSTTMRSYGTTETIINYRYKKPGFVRMDFVTPHKGAALVYLPTTGKVELRPFGFAKALTLTMKPTARLVRSPSGHRVDESDIGVLIENALKLSEQGSENFLREETRQKTLMVVLEIVGRDKAVVHGVNRYLLWMDKKLKLPRVVESYDAENQLIEGLFLDDLIINPEFAEIFDL